MSRKNKLNDLLEDVTSEAEPSDFRTYLFNETLLSVKRKRRFIYAKRAAVPLLGLALVVALAVLHSPSRSSLTPVRRPYAELRTVMLGPEFLISTERLAASSKIATQAGIQMVSTQNELKSYRLVNDDQLLALAGTDRAYLRRGPTGEEQLMFFAP